MPKKRKLTKKAIVKYIEKSLSTPEIPLDSREKENRDTFCDVVDEYEIYLLKDNPDYDPTLKGCPPYIRTKRICGALRSKELNLRCRYAAGYGTGHPGFGQCNVHENRGKGSVHNLRLLEGYRKKGLALNVKELVEQLPRVLSDSDLYTVRDEIYILEELLKTSINTNFVNPKEVVGITDALLRAKATGNKIKTEKLLVDVVAINTFVNAIFEVLRKHLGQVEYSKIAENIRSDVVFPMNKSLQDEILKIKDNKDNKDTSK